MRAREQKLLDQMEEIAERSRHLPDAKVRRLLDWIRENLCPDLRPFGVPPRGALPKWNNRRVLIFTENREGTKRYLKALLEQAIEGTASSPWAQARIIKGANDVFLARIRLEGARGPDPGRLFSIVEQVRGRALLELLSATPAADVRAPSGLKAGERRLAALQVQLFQTKTRAERARLLDQIFVAEEQLAPLTTAFFDRTRRTTARRPVMLRDVQRALRDDELFLEFALAEPRSYALVVTRVTARVQALAGRAIIAEQLKALVERIRSEQRIGDEARTLAAVLTGSVRELADYKRVIISPDAELHHIPFELLPIATVRSSRVSRAL
jgi:hypothetical protein